MYVRSIAASIFQSSIDNDDLFSFESCIASCKNICENYTISFDRELGKMTIFNFSDGSIIRTCEPTTDICIEQELLPWAKFTNTGKFSRGCRSAIDGWPLFGYNINEMYGDEEVED